MRGEFLRVWSDTWREIWSPLAELDEAPDDVFVELYQKLVLAFTELTPEAAQTLVIKDAILRKEIFSRSLLECGLDLVVVPWEQMYDVALTDVDADREMLVNAVFGMVHDLAKSLASVNQALANVSGDTEKCKQAFRRSLDEIANDPERSREAFEQTQASDFVGERAIIRFLEEAHSVLQDLADESLTNHYFNLLEAFIEKFSLRYDLRRPCTLCPTLPGIFTRLLSDLRTATAQDTHFDGLRKDFEAAVRDLRIDDSDARIRTCIQKQINLLEALGSRAPGVTGNTLGRICDQVGTWPHEKIKEAIKALYTFTCDYPGIRHGGTPANAIRTIEMKDLVALSIVLAGFTPYLTDQLDANMVYLGT
jgi:hypothetical protein